MSNSTLTRAAAQTNEHQRRRTSRRGEEKCKKTGTYAFLVAEVETKFLKAKEEDLMAV